LAIEGGTVAEPRTSDEEYLATLFELEEDAILAIRARVAERLGVSPAAVSEAVERLTERGYLVDSDDRQLRLTGVGREIAVTVVRRHRLAERLLVDVLGLAWVKAHREAARWEHAISEEVEERLVDVLGDPATCPHGNPIPGSRRPVDLPAYVLLAAAPPGPVTIARISEQLQVEDAALDLLARGRLLPGCAATILMTDRNKVTVRTPAGDLVVPARLAQQVWVAPP
jgi:DtxR family Mn-dependent transcriptional regulator